ncbi:MAG TPA: cytochrome P450 [Acidimicrobiales bacterium]|jgi:cytochrome P450|nr:cytochrome P450 [Acidimicrobiales bacterium]
MTIPTGLAGLDISRPGFYLRDDYYEVLSWLRANDPVHRTGDGTVLISRYDDIRQVSRDPSAFTSRRGAILNDPVRVTGANDAAGSLVHLDPPLHADYRRLLNREFTPRAVARMEETIVGIVSRTFDTLDARLTPGQVIDFVEDVALPVPVLVIAELLDITEHPLPDIRRWSDATISVSDDPTAQVIADVTEFAHVLAGHVRRTFESVAAGTSGDDLLSLLASSQVGDQPLTSAQVQLFCLTLMVAGNETTRSLISGGAQALAEHPDQRAALIRDPALIPAAVEECLRWVTPIQAFCRTAVSDIPFGGAEVRAGDYMVLLYASGNRDEDAFGPGADRFDVHRAASPAHVAFGFGEHLCLGASLARLEARLVFEELLRRYPDYRVAGHPVWVPSTLTRGVSRLPVILR